MCQGDEYTLRSGGLGSSTSGGGRLKARLSLWSTSGAIVKENRRHSARTPPRRTWFQPRPAHIAPSFREKGTPEFSTAAYSGVTNAHRSEVESPGSRGVRVEGARSK